MTTLFKDYKWHLEIKDSSIYLTVESEDVIASNLIDVKDGTIITIMEPDRPFFYKYKIVVNGVLTFRVNSYSDNREDKDDDWITVYKIVEHIKPVASLPKMPTLDKY